MNIITITIYLQFTVAVHSSEDQIHSQILSYASYYDNPCHQQLKQTMEIITNITCLLITVHLHYSEDDTLADI